MGILPLQYKSGQTRESLGLTGKETFAIAGLDEKLKAQADITVTARREDGSTIDFTTTCRIDTPVEVEYYRNGGILQTVLRNMLNT
jgi:aconitate hydratase